MVRAPTRLEILTTIEKYVDEILKKVSINDITYFTNLIKYIEETKRRVIEELEYRRKIKVRSAEKKKEILNLIVNQIVNVCIDKELSIEELKRRIKMYVDMVL